jgi:hypothetical protein
MKDKTDAMNRGHGNAPEKGYESIPDSEVPKRRVYKNDQLKGAGLLDNKALQYQEDMNDEYGNDEIGGFLPRNNFHDRF